MTASRRRSTIAILIAVSILGATMVVGGVAGQTATETPNETATETATGPDTETPVVPPGDGPGTPTEAGPETPTDVGPVTEPADGAAAGEETVAANGTNYEQDVAFMRVAHASPDAGPVDVYVDGERALSDVAFGEVSAYMTLPADEHNVTIAPAGTNESAGFSTLVDLEHRSASTLFAAGEVGPNATQPFDPVRYPDDAFRPAANESAVSVSHMSPDAPVVDVTADGGSVVIAENISYREASEYTTVPAGEHSLEIRQAASDNDGPIVATVNVTLEGGTAYSAIAAGYAGGNLTAAQEGFRVVLAEDASKTMYLPVTGVEGAETTPDAGEEAGPATETPTDGATETETGEVTATPTEPGPATPTEGPEETETEEPGAEGEGTPANT